MYASVRRYRVKPGAAAEISKRASAGFVPIVSKGPGFVAYYLIDAGSDVVATISIFEDRAGAEESNRSAAAWVKENVVSLVSGPPEITAGEVTVHHTR